jgi:ketosteroid isomerase-like protein
MTESDSPERVAHAFVDAISRQSVEALAKLMAEDHIFIDSLGARVVGRDKMTAGWTGYFGMVPDYTITIEETYSNGDVVVMVGTAQGTYAGTKWQTPAAFRAVIRDSLVAEWRVYADNEPIRALMRKSG